MDDKQIHPACALAVAQAAKDNPGYSEFKATILESDESRFVVLVHCGIDGMDIFPSPSPRYAVSRDLTEIFGLD